MLRTLKNLFKQDREKFVVPKSVQNVIPIKTIWEDGIFLVGRNKYAKTFKFEDINYAVASREDKEAMFLEYSELLNSLDSGATTKITINNRRLNKADFEQTILIPMADDGLDKYRKEYNKMLLDKATGANSIVQDKYVTVSVCKKNIEEARNYFARVGADLIAHFNRLGSKCVELDAGDKLRIFHDFYRTGEETAFHFDITQTMRKGHDFKDFICPDTFEFESDCFRMGDRYGRVIFLREYAAYIKDSMLAELCELNRNMMLSVDIIPVPTDEAVQEVENRLLGVETNITNWQRKQNQNNNFSAVIPYDLEQQRKESKEFLDDLTTRDQRMMFAVVIILIVVLLGCAVSLFGGGSGSNAYTPVSAEVEAYTPLIQKYAKQYGIPEYVELIKAVMMQESGGRGLDPMQAAEGSFNTRYPHEPNGIQDPEYSIECGVQELKAALISAEVENPIDMEHIKLALQGYNFGNGYISWAKTNYGGYSYANAVEFSTMQAARLGWDSYGDTQYPAHVLLYYPYGRAFTISAERTSAIGCAYKIPFNPHINGKIKITGMKQIPCRQAPRINPSFPFPRARNKEEYTV